MNRQESGEQLVRQAQKGDRSAFESLYRANVGRVYAVCRRLTGSAEEAEDMTQETFIRAWQKIGSFHPESSLKPDCSLHR